MTDKRTRYVTVRFTEAERLALVAKARRAGVTTSDLLRDQLVQGRVFANRMPTRSDALLLERMAVMLTVVAERSRVIEDKAVALAIVTQLVAIESELNQRRQEAAHV